MEDKDCLDMHVAKLYCNGIDTTNTISDMNVSG